MPCHPVYASAALLSRVEAAQLILRLDQIGRLTSGSRGPCSHTLCSRRTVQPPLRRFHSGHLLVLPQPLSVPG